MGSLADTLSQFAGWVVPTLTGAIIGFTCERIRAGKAKRAECDRERDALRDASVLLLKCELVRLHEMYVVDEEPFDVPARERVQKTYAAYRALGGNELGTRMYEERASLKTTG